ncbi:hypothetical protein OBBRIDRAFT_718223, partial [Obba rivulosa]
PPTLNPSRTQKFHSTTDGDTIVYSSDGIDFQLFKLLLSLASPVFKDMVAIPLADTSAESPHEIRDGLPIVPISEESRT